MNVHLGLNEGQRLTQLRRIGRIIDDVAAPHEAIV
jgi:hypothetical protein